VDILATSMLVNFLVMCIAVLTLPHRNPALAREVRFLRTRSAQIAIGASGAAVLTLFLIIQVGKDLRSDVAAWYLHSTWWWVAVVTLASVVYWRERVALRRSGVDVEAVFSKLPPG